MWLAEMPCRHSLTVMMAGVDVAQPYLIQEQDLWVLEDRPCDGQALLLPAAHRHAALAHRRVVPAQNVTSVLERPAGKETIVGNATHHDAAQ